MEFELYVTMQLVDSNFGCVLLGLIRKEKFRVLALNLISPYLIALDIDPFKNTGRCYVNVFI